MTRQQVSVPALGRQQMTERARSAAHGVTLLWSTDFDGNGGRWFCVHDPSFPLLGIAFYFERDGTNSGVRIDPYRVMPNGEGAISGQLTSRMVRSIPLAELEQKARSFARRAASFDLADAQAVYPLVDTEGRRWGAATVVPGGGPGSPAHRDAIARAAGLARPSQVQKRSGGRPPIPLRLLAEQAERYCDALAIDPRDPISRVAEQSNYTVKQVRLHISRARLNGLLTATHPRRAGGDLTPKARQILAGEIAED